MFKEMRRRDRQITVEEAEKILLEGEYGVLSTQGSNGYSYGIPLSYAYKDGSIFFHCALEGQKVENIKHCNKVSFCVVGKTQVQPDKFGTVYESAIVFGEASELSGQDKEEALLALIEKYSKEYMEAGRKYIKNSGAATKVFNIKVEHISGKAKY
jgi:nitroimidazol reductase NimA-like FMN-containing flavoprotein (pyridoxamine 5'-phosphate oxidase superfamily)